MAQKPPGWHNGIISLWNLPKDKVYVDLNEDFKRKFIKRLKETFGTKTELAKAINESFDDIRNFFDRGQTKSLEFIEKLLLELEKHDIKEFDFQTIEKNISCIQAKNGKKIHNPKFPINFNTQEGAASISAVFHDGGITKGTLCPFYRNYKREKILYVKDCFNKVIGNLNFSMQNNNTKIVFPNIYGIILINGLGLGSGAKTILNPHFPQFVFTSTENIKASFLKQAFDDEGSISLGGGKSRQIAFFQSVDVTQVNTRLREKIRKYNKEDFCPNIMKDTKKLLLSLNIKVNKPKIHEEYISKKGRISHIWKFTISHKNNLKTFNEKIGFGIFDKQRILNFAIDSYTANRLYPEMNKDF